jgi:CRISPR-associated protein Cmr6
MNLHYLFNVKYYKGLYDTEIKQENNINRCNNQLIAKKLQPSEIDSDLNRHSFKLKTAYPGLLIGLGYPHETGKQEEIKLGFTLDYVTGLPVIPGSTVKGVLRSAFSNHPEYILDLLQNIGMENIGNIKDIENEIFGDSKGDKENTAMRDVFYDAVIVKAGKENRLLGLENITPHKTSETEYNGLTEPNPLTLLKVIPNVVFLFPISCL